MSKVKVRNRLWITDTVAKASVDLYARRSSSASLGAGFLRPPSIGLDPFGASLKLKIGLGLPTFGSVLRPPTFSLLQPPVASFTTNSVGVADLKVKAIPDGKYLCSVTPPDVSFDPVGPATASDLKTPKGIYRMVAFEVTVSKGTVTLDNQLNSPDGTAVQGSGEIIVGLQPVWMKSPKHGTRGGKAITLIVVHHTATNTHNSIQTFMSEKGPHYMIDTDGQIVKFVQETQRAFHAGFSRWAGDGDINFNSIGIEIVNKTEPYPEAQYVALIGLLDRLLTANAKVLPRNIVGHSDIATQDGGGNRLGRKSSDPGMKFEWTRLEKRGWGLLKGGGAPGAIYGGFFDSVPGGVLHSGDSDSKRRFGGVHRAKMDIHAVEELQNDLTDIGYSLDTPDGNFGKTTEAAVAIIQEHFFAGGRGHKKPDGKVDLLTAQLIKSVRATAP